MAPNLAPNLAPAQHALIRDMIADGSFTYMQIARTLGCSRDAVKAISANLRRFGSTTAPHNGTGRPKCVTPQMLEALCEHLVTKPDLYRDEMVAFLWDQFHTLASSHTISRALRTAGWSRKVARRVAQQRHPDLRDWYLHDLSEFSSYQLVFVDESGCDHRDGFRRTGRSPVGVPPIQVTPLQRGQRHQILPAYTQEGILLSRVFQGSTDHAVFEDFIAELLGLCNPWPERNSVLVMDNASFHHSKTLEKMCADAGIKLVYLPPYSPDFNPIEEFFAELKAFLRRHWKVHEEDPTRDFATFLEWCVDTVGRRKESAEGHFRHAGIVIEEP